MENIIHIDISFHNNNNSNSILSKALFEELIFGVAYIWSGLCTEGNLHLKSIGLALFLVGNLPFFFVLLCI